MTIPRRYALAEPSQRCDSHPPLLQKARIGEVVSRRRLESAEGRHLRLLVRQDDFGSVEKLTPVPGNGQLEVEFRFDSIVAGRIGVRREFVPSLRLVMALSITRRYGVEHVWMKQPSNIVYVAAPNNEDDRSDSPQNDDFGHRLIFLGLALARPSPAV